MSLKVPSVGSPLTHFEYSFAKSNESSVLITILYSDSDGKCATCDKVIAFRVCPDSRGSINESLDYLYGFIGEFLEEARGDIGKKMKIDYNDDRTNYLTFSGTSNDPREKRFTGQYYKGNEH
jgi:hypothetical protein